MKALLERAGDAFHNGGCLFFGVDPDIDPELFKFKPKEINDLAESGLTLATRSRLVMWVLKRFHWLMFGFTASSYATRSRQAAMVALEKQLKREGVEVVVDDGDREATTAAGAGAPQVLGEARDIPVVGAREPEVESADGGAAVAVAQGDGDDDNLGPSA